MSWTVRFVEEGKAAPALFATEMVAPLDMRKGQRLGPTPEGDGEVWLLVETRERVDAKGLVQDVVLRRQKPSWLERLARWYDKQNETWQVTLAFVALVAVLALIAVIVLTLIRAIDEGTLIAHAGSLIRPTVAWSFVLLVISGLAIVFSRNWSLFPQVFLGGGAVVSGAVLAYVWFQFSVPEKPPEAWVWPGDQDAYARDLFARSSAAWAMASGALSWLVILAGALGWNIVGKFLAALEKR